jgi:hypothetical protein
MKGTQNKNNMKSHFLKQSIMVCRLILFTILTILTISSCNKEEIDNNGTVTNDNYYVKYVLSSNYPRLFSNWSVTTPGGSYTKNNYQIRQWEQTYGPVKKGFKCAVQIGIGEPTIEIHVAKNQQPFALKNTKTGMSASYTIDF